jgi:hypothetical protein
VAEKVKILQYDFGLCTEFGARMARDGYEVYYFCPWENAFPKSSLAIIGENFDGLKRVLNFWDYIDQVDMTCCFDTFFSDIADYLWRHGYKVFAAGKAEILENNRWKMRQIQKVIGLPTQTTRLIKGIDNLLEHLKENKNKIVKLNTFRGDIETFKHNEYDITQAQFLGELTNNIGAKGKNLEFIVEDVVGEVEPGYDGFVVDGQYPDWAMYGYEQKGIGYVGKVVRYNELPPAIKLVNDKMAPVFKKLAPNRTFFSTEIRVDKEGKGYLIDPCVSEDTEILTNKGWKIFKDLDGSELIATLNPETKEIEYQKPIAYQKYWYEGEMIRIANSSIDVLVTPEHKFWITTPKNKKLHPVEARNLPKMFSIPRTGKWKGIELEYFILPEYKNKWHSGREKGIDKEKYYPPLIIKMEDWLRFLGIYLAEGNCNRWVVNIAQTTKREEMKEIIKKLPFNFSEDKKGFRIFSVQLINYLKQFGYANEKFVPDFVKELSPRLINIFLDAFCLGDGSIRKNGARRFYTTSPKLRDDIQELLLKVGSVGNYYLRQKRGTTLVVKGKKYIRKFDGYVICERKKYQNFLKEWNDDCIKKEFYRGFVYDVTVLNHIIYIRRNGKPLWTSNCVRAPMPVPSAIHLEIWQNISDFIVNAALYGKLTPLKPIARYGAGICFESSWADEHWTHLPINPKVRQWIKLRMAAKIDNEYYALPGFMSLGSIIGLGNTVQEAIDNCKKNVELSGIDKIKEVSYSLSGLEEIAKDVIPKGQKYGISF